jgi:hypothetical protein
MSRRKAEIGADREEDLQFGFRESDPNLCPFAAVDPKDNGIVGREKGKI